MLYYPVTSLTPVYFDRHRGFAMGIAMAGSGAGGLVLAPVTQSLLTRFGAPVTLRILGVWNFAVCIPISFVMRPHPAYRPVRPTLELATRGTFIVQVRKPRVSTPTHPLSSIDSRRVFASRGEHNTVVLSDHLRGLCGGLLADRRQHAFGNEQRRQ
jgi:MFS family permease